MSRPPTPIGHWGHISTRKLGDGVWEANATYRTASGGRKRVRARGPSRVKSENALVAKINKEVIRSGAGSDITGKTTFSELVQFWEEEAHLAEVVRPQTLDEYSRLARNVLMPLMGEMLVSEITVSAVDRVYKTILKKTRAQARNAKIVLQQIVAIAVRHGVLVGNPVREVVAVKRKKSEIHALSEQDRENVRESIRAYQNRPGRPGPSQKYLSELLDVILGTSCRIGEALALQWVDIDITSNPAMVTVTGTIVEVKGVGLIRQPFGKTGAAYRTVRIPPFVAEVLRSLKLQQDDSGMVFHTRKSTFVSPHTIYRSLRRVRDFAGLPDWVIPHVFRKTVATVVDNELGIETASRTLGHSSTQITEDYYVQKPVMAPDASMVLETLGPRGASVAEKWDISELNLET